MPIISTIGRKNIKTRGLIGLIYGMLILGAISMVYPFALMMAGSTKSTSDSNEMRLIPGYLTKDSILYRKFIEGLFNERLLNFKVAYDRDDVSFEKAQLPDHINDKLVDTWVDFLEQQKLPDYTYATGFMQVMSSAGVQPEMLRRFMSQLSQKYHGDIHQLNQDLETDFISWSSFFVQPPFYYARQFTPRDTLFAKRVQKFYREQPKTYRYYFSSDGYYKSQFLKTQYTKDIAVYNKSHNTHYASYNQISLPARFPRQATALEKKDWEDFVRNNLNILWIRADAGAAKKYHAFLKAKYLTVQALNQTYKTSLARIEDIPLVTDPATVSGIQLADWISVIEGWKDPQTRQLYQIPIEFLYIHSMDEIFRHYLKNRFGSLDKINATLGTSYKTIASIPMPQRQWHYRTFQKLKKHLRWEFTIRNYISVINYMVLHGRGVFNTVVYCALAILASLLVNPLAAYAMSRYQMPSTYKILLFLMLTMAFPPMVTQIPNFLMLRELNLLNTFWALILPGLANGYSIFLLKGFFDSLPKELYESASLDGASEWVLFWQITMNLSKPILAVIALGAFNLAYTNFMFALLICQDEKMWTLMVWLYQLQMRSSQGVVFASLLIAALPTFLVFAFAQNIIMRGIVVPVEK